MQFRKDINGLRAIAVIAVLLFHFNASWLPGGFAGVDVFLVISGFLMTGIIFRGIDQQNFSVMRFYVARANRIIPALAVLCLVLILFGWFYLTPFDYQILGLHAGSSLGFLSNFVYWKEAGYFDAASQEKWLLHSWSLSVEWQFYMLYPLVLVAMRQFMPIKIMKATVLLGTILGFIFCILVTYKWPNPAYYLLHARAWEMMLGGVAYLYPISLKEGAKKRLEWLGLVLIVGSYVFISKQHPWPGYLALLPVLGAFFIIQAHRNNSLITGNIVAQKLGAWSYSIYLWHWPLVVAMYYFSLNLNFIYVGILLSVVLGFLSHRYVEKLNFRKDFAGFSSYLKCKPIYMVLGVGILASAVFLSLGAKNRFNLPPNIQAIQKELVMPLRNNGYCFYSFNDGHSLVDKEVGSQCYLGQRDPSASKTLLFGDSYAGHNEPFFDELFKANNASLQSIVTNWCSPSLTKRFSGPQTSPAYRQCLLNRDYVKENMHRYKNIIFAGAWDNVIHKKQLADVKSIVDKAAALGINVFIMAGPYRYRKNPLQDFERSIYFDFPFDIKAIQLTDDSMSGANARLQEFSKKYSNVHFIRREMLYSRSGTFDVDAVTVPYSLDGGHISVLGSKYSAKHFINHDNYQTLMKHFSLQ